MEGCVFCTDHSFYCCPLVPGSTLFSSKHLSVFDALCHLGLKFLQFHLHVFKEKKHVYDSMSILHSG